MKLCAHFPMTTLRSSLLSPYFFPLWYHLTKNEHVMTRGDSKDASSGLASGPNPAGAINWRQMSRTRVNKNTKKWIMYLMGGLDRDRSIFWSICRSLLQGYSTDT